MQLNKVQYFNTLQFHIVRMNDVDVTCAFQTDA